MVFTSFYIFRPNPCHNISQLNYISSDISQSKILKHNGGKMLPEYCSRNGNNGFTLMETIVTVGILSVLLAIAVPSITSFLPGYRLKSAAQDLYSNMQSAKMEAVKSNSKCSIVFDAANNLYTFDGRDISLTEYGSGVAFGSCDGSPAIGYSNNNPVNTLIFTSNGMAQQVDTEEWVYIKNNKDKCYKVGTTYTGFIKLDRAN